MSSHGEVTLNGPGIYVGVAILAVVLIGAIAMTIDAFKRPRYHFGKIGPWGYIMFFAFYVALVAAMAMIRFTGLGAGLAGPIFLMFLGWTVLLGVIEIIYLLGVVFPDDKDRSKRAEYEAEHGIDRTSATERPAGQSPKGSDQANLDTHSKDEGYFDE